MIRAQVLIVTAYSVAALAALFTVGLAPVEHPLAVAATADVAATIAIFAFSFAFANSSFYDAYWSVAPLPIGLYWASHAQAGDPLRQTLVLACLAVWGVRLTHNWARGWQGLRHEDWRYVDLRAQTGRAYWLVSFAGLHLFPTVMVFLGLLGVYVAVTSAGRTVWLLDAAALFVTVGAIWMEARADEELRRFRRSNPEPGAVLDTGLWSLSRHPNYFGEMAFWWGLWLFGVAASPVDWWWTLAGPAAITLMFRFASLPLIEARMYQRRPDYAAHAARTPLVIPWPRRARA